MLLVLGHPIMIFLIEGYETFKFVSIKKNKYIIKKIHLTLVLTIQNKFEILKKDNKNRKLKSIKKD